MAEPCADNDRVDCNDYDGFAAMAIGSLLTMLGFRDAVICGAVMLCVICSALSGAQEPAPDPDQGEPRSGSETEKKRGIADFVRASDPTQDQGDAGRVKREQAQRRTMKLHEAEQGADLHLSPAPTSRGLARLTNTEPTVLAAGVESDVTPPMRPEASADGSARRAVPSSRWANNKRRPAGTTQRVSGESVLVPLEVEPLERKPVETIQLVSDESVLVPLEVEPLAEDVDLKGDNGLVTLVATGAELKSVLRMIADHHGLNLVLGPEVGGPVTVSIRGARMEEVLDAILGVAGFAWHRVDNLLYVTGVSAAGMDPRVQGRTLQVYPLDYVAAAEVEAVANGLLSPVGSAYVSQADSADQLKTREALVVEDTPSAHARVSQYIAQIDIPPRQVLVEAHVLQIALSEEQRHGIDLRALTRLGGASITLEGTGFTDSDSGGRALTLRLDGQDMNGLIQLIRQNSNSRTLASPKLSVVNHQEAKIQIGQRLPYSVSTTTQTTTVESVEFLEVGIVLTVLPIITNDGNVLMNVFPKVSGGKITDNGFPEEETTEVQTTILMPDGGGVIIGGLIREDNVQNRAMVPFFGRIPVLGHLFRRRSDECRRNELIVALVTHVMPEGCAPRTHEIMELNQTLPDYAACELLQNQTPVIHYELSDH